MPRPEVPKPEVWKVGLSAAGAGGAGFCSDSRGAGSVVPLPPLTSEPRWPAAASAVLPEHSIHGIRFRIACVKDAGRMDPASIRPEASFPAGSSPNYR